MLRDYQQRAINMIYDWFSRNPGNLCVSMPMGAGKSHVIAALCQGIMANYPDSKILMLTHVRELIEQDLDKLVKAWPDAPVGVYSAGLKRKEIKPVTFAGIQSLRNHVDLVGRIDLVIVDEAHLINNADFGIYRKTLATLKEVNPLLRVIGLTATPYRLGQGVIYGEEGCIFDGLVEPVGIPELIARGFLLPLRSKLTEKQIDLTGVKKIAGEYSLRDLEEQTNTEDNNSAVINEILERGKDRKKWLIFCAGVGHALAVRDQLRVAGIDAETVTGNTPSEERRRILDDFRHGDLRAVTNANVLTTGFDCPEIDLIAMLRATESPGLYLQMAGRGMRLAPHKKDCLYLDFVGNVRKHGPVIDVAPPKKKGQSKEAAPTKICPCCEEICSRTAKECPACGHVFEPEPREIKPITHLYADDIMAETQVTEHEVSSWRWRYSTSKAGNPMLSVTYYVRGVPPYGQQPREFFPITSEYRLQQLRYVLDHCDIDIEVDVYNDLQDEEFARQLVLALDAATPPRAIAISKKKGQKYVNVVKKYWHNPPARAGRALGASAIRSAVPA